MVKRTEHSGWIVGLPVSVLLGAVLSGCAGAPPLVEVDDVMDPGRIQFEEAKLTPAKLAKRMAEIDAQYAEPRTPKKVELSLETAELSISRVNNYEALWRGARACYWLAGNLPDVREREKYAVRGYRMALEAKKYLSTRAEPWYYAALNLGAYAGIRHDRGDVPARRWLHRAKYHAEMAAALDEEFDYAGAHRFLGKLMIETSGSLTHSVGSFEKGLEHLKRAVELSPEFAQNHLFLAEAYMEDDEYAAARSEIEEVIRSSVPPDHSVEHREWMREATGLLADLPPSDSDTPTVDVSSFTEDEKGQGK